MIWILALLLSTPGLSSSSFEFESDKDKHHVTADRTLYHSKEKVYEAFGHVVISSQGKRLSAEYAWIDTATKELKAKGNVVFVDTTTTVQAAEIHYNMDTNFGSIFYGKVFNDYYTLKGQLIRKVGVDRFLTTEGEYTTCKDCAESWKLSAKNVDLTLDGYAFMDSVYVKIKDVPTVYIPYLIIPVKNRRQTGFLFPKMSAGNKNGFTFVQPFFLVLDDHQDMTFGLGRYSAKGPRYEFEHRYKSYEGIEGILRYKRIDDRQFSGGYVRQSIYTQHEWPVAKHFKMRWRVSEVTDRDYPTEYPDDLPGVNLPNLESGIVANIPSSEFFASAEVKRYRNLLTTKIKGFDDGTVQAMPSMYFGLKERPVLGPFMTSFYGRYDHFTRQAGPYNDLTNNRVYDPEVDNLREADRFILAPEISAPFRLGPFVSMSPSFQYNEIRYVFPLPDNNKLYNGASQRWLQSKLEASTVIESVFKYNGEKVNKFKHQISPFVTYSYIPWRRSDEKHPFFERQLSRDGGLFDQFDIVPLTNSSNFLRLPLGNSLYYGFTSRIITKQRPLSEKVKSYPYDLPSSSKPKKAPIPLNYKQELMFERAALWEQYEPMYSNYSEIWNLSVSQAYDFIDAKKHPDDKARAFSFLYAKSGLYLEKFSNSIDYKYYPTLVQNTLEGDGVTTKENVYRGIHSFSTTSTLYLANVKNLRGTRSFVRSISASYSNNSKPNSARNIGTSVDWAFSDFLSVGAGINYDLLTHKELDHNFKTIFTHPSECWRVGFRYSRTASTGEPVYGLDLGVNLDGNGFVGVNQSGSSGSGSGIFGGGG